ncbi:TetR/AcrR family transcriptional regulator [Paenibacillus ferrarius]|uniref:TetR/AcrR family transcriptional regulator n=1 Tax=Paenibacillus ferrarius TaxID=1469647 RepID=UPI003D27C8EC
MTDPTKPAVKTDRRILRSKRALREALLALMAQKPFATISITEIVEQANYNRGTFYANYESKEALLDDVFAELIQELLQSFRAPYEKVAIFRINELQAQSVMIFQHVYANAKVYTTLLQSDVLPVLKQKMFLALKHISREELLYEATDIDPELAAVFSINALLGLLFHWIESGFQHSTAYMQEQLIKLIHYHPRDARTAIKPPK